MALREPSFSLGIEEEYLLIDKTNCDLVAEPPERLLEDCQHALEAVGQVSPEFMRSQMEVGTRVCTSIAEARGQLARMRTTIAHLAGEYGIAPIAASTHPFARWHSQRHTDKERYHVLAADMQLIARRMLISGMHVHVAIEDDDLRIDIMNQACYFLPHLLALSTSSPFWQGRISGLKSYRLSVFDELPRTGLPEYFTSFAEYERTIAVLVNAGLIEDATKVWWDLRPSARFPTLEMRITDICTYLDDGMAVAALYLCICRMLYRLRRENQRWRSYAQFLIMENRWRAQRYGIDDRLIDFGRSELKTIPALIEELLALVKEDAEALGCWKELTHVRTILKRGTSADRQLAVYHDAINAGAEEREAICAVVRALMRETVEGLETGPVLREAEAVSAEAV
jgi:glutamate---cysteine ligase / carboxylate-amine ligase